MVGLWKGYPLFRSLCADSEGQKENEESHALLQNCQIEKEILPQPSHFTISTSHPADTTQPSVRYMSFGIGGAGNVRRWV
ncbi:hypothetical protein PENSUB_10535 [Penicillium subrubescens]|jgi:DNA gyrase inhibitor GyrI|uniref:Uncharacterized protein n=1 Tax=Penicillium subrubescens TaxID=1316194 RepID=A0A1Q5T816_9EURO|nr:hypothetical protein PENSUB_10535 [Penicillium subrubescens]